MRPTPPSNHTHMLCMDKKQSLTGTDTQAKPSICCCTSTFDVGSYLRRVATNVVIMSVSVRLSVHNLSYISCNALNIFLKLVIVLSNGYSEKTYAVIGSVKVIHSGQSLNVNILCMRHNLNGLKLVHENKHRNIADNLQRKDI